MRYKLVFCISEFHDTYGCVSIAALAKVPFLLFVQPCFVLTKYNLSTIQAGTMMHGDPNLRMFRLNAPVVIQSKLGQVIFRAEVVNR